MQCGIIKIVGGYFIIIGTYYVIKCSLCYSAINEVYFLYNNELNILLWE